MDTCSGQCILFQFPGNALIRSQYTPIDTLVFGGNFLHSYNVATRESSQNCSVFGRPDDYLTELKIRDIELATHVPKKFRFPYFVK